MSITLYTRPDCRECDAARRYLDERGDPYVERDISSDALAEQEVVAITGGALSVPITVEDGDIRVGFPYQ